MRILNDESDLSGRWDVDGGDDPSAGLRRGLPFALVLWALIVAGLWTCLS